MKHNLRKWAREEVTHIPSIYNDALVDIATNSEENEVFLHPLASSLHFIGLAEVGYHLSLKAEKISKLKASGRVAQPHEENILEGTS